ncbi:phage tail terminator-like protein [Snodgrassella alvi]|uniref:phage tail terminator-like protein n=1 Tax=Snodgrassella alvi TaxID=1196083 RepID=UPI0034614365
MLFNHISNALEQRLAALPNAPPVYYDNQVPEVPPQGAFFIAKNLPKPTIIDTLDATEIYSGIFSINIYTPAEIGRAMAENYADALHGFFFNKRFNGLLTSTVSRSQGMATATHYMINVSIRYQTITE